MTIPKIIHYCWFGKDKKPKTIDKCIKSWDILKKKGFVVKEWNDTNIDFNSHPYLMEAYLNKRWAFVSDYVRLKALYEYGGVYLDTDMELKKDITPFMKYDLFMGFMFDTLIGTAIIGANRRHHIVKEILEIYDTLEYKGNPNNSLYTKYLLDHYELFRLKNKIQFFENNSVAIYPKEYFERPTYNHKINYCVHHYSASWKKKNSKIRFIKKIIKLIIGDVIYKKVNHRLSIKKTPFYNVYLRHKFQK